MRSLAVRLPTVSPATALPSPVAWRLPVAAAVLWAILFAAALSTQYLFQPFVWSNWPWDEVLAGWVDILRSRAIVALAIAAALLVASRLPARTARTRAVLLALAIVVGATVGEATLLGAGFSGEQRDLASMIGRTAHWTLLAGSVATMYYLWLRMNHARATAQSSELQAVQMERQIVQARLQALRNQIEPHFLFNTLATVKRLHQSEPLQGVQLLRHLIDYLRLTTSDVPHSHSRLRQEVELVRAYLGVVDVRMSGRLEARSEIPEELLDCAFPPLTLATLVENAVTHGIGPMSGGGTIVVTAQRVGETLEIVVADTGVGFSGTVGSGIGLANIRARLRTLYGARGQLVLESNKPHGVRATVRVPFVSVDPAS